MEATTTILAQQARARALNILQRFQLPPQEQHLQQQQQQQQHNEKSIINHHAVNSSGLANGFSHPPVTPSASSWVPPLPASQPSMNFRAPPIHNHSLPLPHFLPPPPLSLPPPFPNSTPPPPLSLPQPPLPTLAACTSLAPDVNISLPSSDLEAPKLQSTAAPSEYSKKRKEAFDAFNKRKKIALLKNLEYVARRQGEILKDRLVQIDQTKDYEDRVSESHHNLLKARSQRRKCVAPAPSQAALGTKERRNLEHKRKRQTQHLRKGKHENEDSLALYISGLPTTLETTTATAETKTTNSDDQPSSSSSTSLETTKQLEQTLRALFGSYGKLRKVHVYHHKGTHELKGDALVVYHIFPDDDRSSLAESVCSQMNGAELPDGSVLHVEVSDPLHKLRKPNKQNRYGPASEEVESTTQSPADVALLEEDAIVETNNTDGSNERSVSPDKGDEVQATTSSSDITMGNQAGSDTKTGDDDDLDDFFSSLE